MTAAATSATSKISLSARSKARAIIMPMRIRSSAERSGRREERKVVSKIGVCHGEFGEYGGK